MEQIAFFKDLCEVLDTKEGSLVAGTKATGVLDTLGAGLAGAAGGEERSRREPRGQQPR